MGGASLLHAFDGSGIWRGDVLFILAAMCWSMYSVLVRRFALDAVQATDGVPLATPANWQPGQDVIVALALNNDQAKERFGDLDIKLPYLRFAKAPK